MATQLPRNPERKDFARMSDYGARAAYAVDVLLPPGNRDKRLARLLGVSVRMAQYLRQGMHWSTDRLTQASRVFGPEFDRLLCNPDDGAFHAEIADLRRRLDELAQRMGERR